MADRGGRSGRELVPFRNRKFPDPSLFFVCALPAERDKSGFNLSPVKIANFRQYCVFYENFGNSPPLCSLFLSADSGCCC